MPEADRAGRRRRRADACPRIQSDVMVVAAGRHKERARSVALHHIESQYAHVERLRVGEARHVEVHVADRGGASEAGPRIFPAAKIAEDVLEVERLATHLQAAADVWPVATRA